MTFKSRDSYFDFDKSVRLKFRYIWTPEQTEFLKEVVATSHLRALTMKAETLLWRAQLGHDWREESQGEESFHVHSAHPPQRMKPLFGKASDGRANPRGIACLYLATKRETAVLEVRPVIGSYVSVAEFKTLRDLRLVNCFSIDIGNLERFLKEDWTLDDTEKQVWADINKAFSAPVERGDDSLDYVPTQIITEALKLDGVDGIVYKSSYGENGYNVALFDVAAADLSSCGLHRVKNVSVSLSGADNPYFVNSSTNK